MGVDCYAYLSPNVRIHEVAEVIGILLGLPKKKETLSEADGESWYIKVDGVKIASSPTPSLAIIETEVKLVFFYHFENDTFPSYRLVSARSYPEWIAISKKLVDFFGGKVIFDDCNGEVNYEQPNKADEENSPSDGEPWQNLQERMFNLTQITNKDIDKVRQFAAYDKKLN